MNSSATAKILLTFRNKLNAPKGESFYLVEGVIPHGDTQLLAVPVWDVLSLTCGALLSPSCVKSST